MEPAQTIIKKLGGPTVVAGVVGVHRTRVSNWQRPRSAGGSDGMIPQRHLPALLDFAHARGIDLKAQDFLPSSYQPQVIDAEKEAVASEVSP